MACAIMCAIASAGTATASDPVPVQAAPTNDSIAAAKRDLDSLKTSSNASAAGNQSNTLPTISVPQVTRDDLLEPVAPATTNPATDQAKEAEKKKANWLVDAMMKPNDSRDADRKREENGHRDRRGESSLDQDGKRAEASRRGDEEGAGRDSDNPAKTTAVTNPLAQYMANWVSPQDYTLLRRTIETPNTNGQGSNTMPVAAPVLTGNDGLALLGGVDVSAIAAPRSELKPPAPADNPYLAALSLPDTTPPPAQSPPPTALAPQTSAPPLFNPPPPEEQPKPTIPDFAKPPEDDKIFKPLKRF